MVAIWVHVGGDDVEDMVAIRSHMGGADVEAIWTDLGGPCANLVG